MQTKLSEQEIDEKLKNIKLIASDLDGTLLLNGAQDLNADTCSLIRALIDKGIIFFAASGRQYTNLQRLFAPIADDIGYLCENGAVSFWKGKRIHKEVMDKALAQELIRDIWNTEGGEVLLSGEMVSYLKPKKSEYFYHMRDVVKNDVVLVDDIFNTPEEYMKISLYEKGGVKNEQLWQERFGSRCTVVTGGRDWLDMMPKGVNKASALKKILAELNISAEQCLAIGDNDNDREMLKMVGLASSVVSAKSEIRSLAAIETDTVENLFRRILKLRDKESKIA